MVGSSSLVTAAARPKFCLVLCVPEVVDLWSSWHLSVGLCLVLHAGDVCVPSQSIVLILWEPRGYKCAYSKQIKKRMMVIIVVNI